MADLFESSLHLEEQHQSDGYQQGLEDGKAAGLQEGHDLGRRKGFEIGYEAGLYEGCVKGWRRKQKNDPNWLPARAEATVAALEQLLGQMPLTDPKDESLLAQLEDARGKFKKVVAMLGTAESYANKDSGSGPLLDF